MEITGLRDIFLSKEEFFDTEVTVSGWVRSNRDSKNFGFLPSLTEPFSHRSKLFTMTIWKTLTKLQNWESELPLS